MRKKGRMAMITVFVEYKLDPLQREAYLAAIPRIKRETEQRGGRGYRWLEGVEQPNTFVETFTVDAWERYEAIRSWRLADPDFPAFVLGGVAKLHIWAFCDVAMEE